MTSRWTSYVPDAITTVPDDVRCRGRPTPARTLGRVARPEKPGARRRGDGRLTHDIDPEDRNPQDACGVFGVWAPGEDVAKLTAALLRVVHPRMGQFMQFAVGLAQHDGIAPACGTTKLADYVPALVAGAADRAA